MRATRPVVSLLLAATIGVVATLVFSHRLEDEPAFVDESAYVAQGYFFDLLIQGQWDDWAWIEYHAYDLPPLPKYAMGASLELAGFRPPGRLAAGAWFRDIRRPIASPAMLLTARWPSLLIGAIGCMALFTIGSLAFGRRVGVLAALLLMINPLYQLHARRAMADVYAESLILATLALGLWCWLQILSGKVSPIRCTFGLVWVGVLGGLAVLSKLNGGIGLLTFGTWALLGALLPGTSTRGRVGLLSGGMLAGVVSLATFAVLNPFVTAHPDGPPPPQLMAPADPMGSPLRRLREVIEHRVAVSRKGQEDFPHNALTSPLDKLAVVAVQGFGRFGPLGPRDHDSTLPYPRLDWSRDAGAAAWLPVVAFGAWLSLRRGFQQRRASTPPTGWLVLLYAAIAFVAVTAFIPLAWDRYLLSIQPGSALLGSLALVAGWDRWIVHRQEGRAEA